MRKPLRILTCVVATGATITAGFGITAPGATADTGITADSIVYNGAGCPVGSTTASVSPDKQAVTITFSEFEVGLPTTQFARTKSCLISAQINVPAGYTAEIGTIDYRGFQDLNGNATSALYTRANLAGQEAVTEEYELTSQPNSWFIRDTISSQVLTPCGPIQAIMTLNARLLIGGTSPGADNSILTLDNQDISTDNPVNPTASVIIGFDLNPC